MFSLDYSVVEEIKDDVELMCSDMNWTVDSIRTLINIIECQKEELERRNKQ